MSLADLMNNSVTVQSLVSDRGASAGAKRKWETRAGGVAVRITDPTAEVLEMFGGAAANISHVLYTFRDDLKVGERLIDEETGLYFLVEATKVRRTCGSIPTFYLIGASEVQPNETQA